MNVKCPRCGKPASFTPENPHRPFCSERCQMIDLGAWAEEKYTIPVEKLSESDHEELMAEAEKNDEESSSSDDPLH